MAKGFHQQKIVYFDETFRPIVKPTAVLTVLSIAVTAGWHLRQIDITKTFLHGFFREKVYMEQTLGFQHLKFPQRVCKLQKVLYGLKQAPRAWFSRLSTQLQELSIVASKSDIIYRSSSLIIFVLIYVNDIIITGPNKLPIDSPMVLYKLFFFFF
jgi:hypothetical protein